MAGYNKTDLVKELSEKSGVKRREVRVILSELVSIACREAKQGGFSLPDLCRFDVVKKKARKMRNPQTGHYLMIAEHEAARVRLLKKAKARIEPARKNLITEYLEDGVTPEPEVPSGPTEVPAEIIYDDFSQAVSFRCKACGGEIEAPMAAVGLTSECPVCGQSVLIPPESEPGTIHGPKLPEEEAAEAEAAAEAAEAEVPAGATPAIEVPTTMEALEAQAAEVFEEARLNAQKNKTIRIDLSTLEVTPEAAPKPKERIVSFFCKQCHQELEAPAEMMGTTSECPACGATFEVPFFSETGTLHGSDLEKPGDEPPAAGSLKGRTIRIEMPDF